MKKLPNIISVLRIIFSICLPFFTPFNSQFWCFYLICGISDIADGYIARKYNGVSKLGAILDSLGDTVFTVIFTVLLILNIRIPTWGFFWIAAITVIKLLSNLVGYFKFQTFAALHTYANKTVGFLLFVGLPLYIMFKRGVVMVFLLMAATLAAIEELLIVIKSENLDRNVKGLFK